MPQSFVREEFLLQTVSGINEPPALKDIRDVRVNGDTISFLYGGSPDVLLSKLASLSLSDVSITEPDFEEIFMHYYAKEGKQYDTL